MGALLRSFLPPPKKLSPTHKNFLQSIANEPLTGKEYMEVRVGGKAKYKLPILRA